METEKVLRVNSLSWLSNLFLSVVVENAPRVFDYPPPFTSLTGLVLSGDGLLNETSLKELPSRFLRLDDSVRCGLVLCKQCAEAIASNRRPPDALVLRWNGDPRMTEAYSPLLPIPEVLTPDWTTDLGIVDAALIASLIAKVRIVAWIFKVTPAGIEVSRQSALRGHQHIRGGKTFFPQDVNAIQACLEARE
uniref:Uncharacterized protein n=1 Tax=Chromera velia CCMP2878 TaxID=1169474 RepID=A0A0K6SAF7_9ALVE|eukprot:Cvel_10689.t1-p1 / transcript=Cvel_10689.t1 / gene=Cvel_10689 / organism=Chromera_velia_CCMP2878 / gene_product=hypothetical protein / transcript_product=hypothetical protein / location=Cvel_scaffold650:6617-7706(-) / protein_length=191 / sequence_SO=supercontig / SO=protein_coding / is_pseudo=false